MHQLCRLGEREQQRIAVDAQGRSRRSIDVALGHAPVARQLVELVQLAPDRAGVTGIKPLAELEPARVEVHRAGERHVQLAFEAERQPGPRHAQHDAGVARRELLQQLLDEIGDLPQVAAQRRLGTRNPAFELGEQPVDVVPEHVEEAQPHPGLQLGLVHFHQSVDQGAGRAGDVGGRERR